MMRGSVHKHRCMICGRNLFVRSGNFHREMDQAGSRREIDEIPLTKGRLNMRFNYSTKFLSILSIAVSATLICSAGLNAKDKTEKKVRVSTLIRPDFDPTAEKVELFEAMDDGKIDAFVIPHNEHHGYIFIENKSDQPVSLKLPRTIVAVQNLKQFGGGGGFGGGQGGFGGGQGGFGGGQGGFGGGGGGQGLGGGGGFGGGQGGGQGGFGGGGGGFGGGGQGGGGFFSIPPQHRVRANLNSVCLEHGKDAPSRTNKYHLVPAEKAIKNDVLMELLVIVGSGQVSAKSAQAATWFLTDGMSFQQLAAKQEAHFGGLLTPYFTNQELAQAQQLLLYAKKMSEARKSQPEGETPVESGYTREELKVSR